MASIFTYDPNPPRVSSPWSTPGRNTPHRAEGDPLSRQISARDIIKETGHNEYSYDAGITRLEPEPQEGSTEYKLHLLLRPRRNFTSSTTGNLVSGSQHSKPFLASSQFRTDPEYPRPPQAPSSQTRQTRLQQLTTQLLWRLQQSSPFHSSSTANLVLPLLPEATPKLGAPVRPAKLLPGLEESQGALYEIGVSDDGTLVGLVEDELAESLTNLSAMAASLGCIVEVLRKVTVGTCEWSQTSERGTSRDTVAANLWVAEALVRPDLDTFNGHEEPRALQLNGIAQRSVTHEAMAESRKEQIRVSFTGASTSGKSSLLGTLSTSTLDNGRGKSRLSLLKHRHEIASGITSSVAQELMGYAKTRTFESADHGLTDIVNYAAKDVTSWNDIHQLSERLVFISDSPGLPRYSKSAIRTLVSWAPHWTILCVAADNREQHEGVTDTVMSAREPLGNLKNPASAIDATSQSIDLAQSHLDLCLKLDLPLIVVITKLDLATKTGLRQSLGKVLTTVKAIGRKPVLLNASTAAGNPSGSSQEIATPGSSISYGTTYLQQVSQEDESEVQKTLSTLANDSRILPIVLTSAVSGAGIGQLHALLRSLPARLELNIAPSPDCMTIQQFAEGCFQVDEVFSIPPSKVYLSGPTGVDARAGVVLCGHSSHGSINVGEEIYLGPFVIGMDDGDVSLSDLDVQTSTPPSAKHLRTYSSPVLSKHMLETGRSPGTDAPKTPPGDLRSKQWAQPAFMHVRIVSIRNLRLPVRTLLPGQVGTIGILRSSNNRDDLPSLLRARKGMRLLAVPDLNHVVRGFTAVFSRADFQNGPSPPLILGGHAMAYINSIRAAVKVTDVLLDESHNNTPPTSTPTDVFNFDDQGFADAEGPQNSDDHTGNGTIKVTFRFISSFEYVLPSDKVLVIPSAAATGPISGPISAVGGLNGFVGQVVSSNERMCKKC